MLYKTNFEQYLLNQLKADFKAFNTTRDANINCYTQHTPKNEVKDRLVIFFIFPFNKHKSYLNHLNNNFKGLNIETIIEPRHKETITLTIKPEAIDSYFKYKIKNIFDKKLKQPRKNKRLKI